MTNETAGFAGPVPDVIGRANLLWAVLRCCDISVVSHAMDRLYTSTSHILQAA